MWLSRRQYKKRLRRAYLKGFARGYELINRPEAAASQESGFRQAPVEDVRGHSEEFERQIRRVVEGKGDELD